MYVSYSSVSLFHFSAWHMGSCGRSRESEAVNCTVIEVGTKLPVRTGTQYVTLHKNNKQQPINKCMKPA